MLWGSEVGTQLNDPFYSMTQCFPCSSHKWRISFVFANLLSLTEAILNFRLLSFCVLHISFTSELLSYVQELTTLSYMVLTNRTETSILQ